MDNDTFYDNPEELTEIVHRFGNTTDDLESNSAQLASRNANLRENWTTPGGVAVVTELETFQKSLGTFITMTLAYERTKLNRCIGLEEEMNNAGTKSC